MGIDKSSSEVGEDLANCLEAYIIRKTKRFSIPERAVQYLKTKRTTETPPIRP